VNDECEGVLVKFDATTATSVQSVLTTENDQQDSLLKKCLGDSNGDATDNTDVYDWDWGTWTNPHLIKLVDATQDAYVEYIRADGSAYKVLTTEADGYYVNDAEADYPVTTLCNNGKNYLHTKASLSSAFDWYYTTQLTTSAGDPTYLGEWGWCKNLNPPGVYAVIYFDNCDAQGVTSLTGGTTSGSTVTCHATTGKWRVINNVGLGHAATTKFHVYTTKGTMQQVSQFAEIHTTRDTMSMNQRIDAYHSNEIFMNNVTSRTYTPSDVLPFGGAGEMDCETLGALGTSGKGTLDCLAYGDKVMFLNIGTPARTGCMGKDNANMAGVTYAASDKLSCQYEPTVTSYNSNPSNPNMYTIKKIAYEPQYLMFSFMRPTLMSYTETNVEIIG
jgi:hypothetical protein